MKRHWIAVLALLLVASAWGATFTLIKNVLREIAPEPFIFWRFTIAGIVLLAFAAARRTLSRALLRPAILLGALVFIGYWLQTHGLLFISPSRSAFLTGLYVVMVPFADRLLRKTRITPRAWIASILAVIGTTLLIGGVDMHASLGDALTIVGAVAFALHVVFSARFTAEHSATGLAAVQVLTVGIVAGIPSLFAAPVRWNASVVGVILFTAIVTTAIAFVMLMWGQARVTATEAAVILAFEPVAASITSIVFEHEPVTRAFLAGAALIFIATVVSQVPSRAESAAS